MLLLYLKALVYTHSSEGLKLTNPATALPINVEDVVSTNVW